MSDVPDPGQGLLAHLHPVREEKATRSNCIDLCCIFRATCGRVWLAPSRFFRPSSRNPETKSPSAQNLLAGPYLRIVQYGGVHLRKPQTFPGTAQERCACRLLQWAFAAEGKGAPNNICWDQGHLLTAPSRTVASKPLSLRLWSLSLAPAKRFRLSFPGVLSRNI